MSNKAQKIQQYLKDGPVSAMLQPLETMLGEEKAQAIVDESLPGLAALHDEVFTEEEIDELNEFYKTSAGRKSVARAMEICMRASEIAGKAAEVVILREKQQKVVH
jgi:hypothetical protein